MRLEMRSFTRANKADAPNPAMTSLFQSGRNRRQVGDLRRSAAHIHGNTSA